MIWNCQAIVNEVARRYGIGPADITGPGQHWPVIHARHVAVYLCRVHTGRSLPKLGKFFGGRSHTTIDHSCRRVKANLQHDPKVKAFIDSFGPIPGRELLEKTRTSLIVPETPAKEIAA